MKVRRLDEGEANDLNAGPAGLKIEEELRECRLAFSSCFYLGVPFFYSDQSVEFLEELAEPSAKFSCGWIRITNWKELAFRGISH